jgi:shikimate dehydrogenase
VLGHPIAHSKSPALHAAAYRRLGLDFSYSAEDLQPADLAGFVQRVRSDGNWFGLSVTMPLKTAIVPLLDAVRGVAATLGVVNTVVSERAASTGPSALRLTGYNTDVVGIVNALRHAGVRGRPTAAILGGGGTAVAAVAALKDLQAPGVDVFARDAGRSSAAVRTARVVGLAHRLRPWTDAAAALAGYDVVISTLPPHAADGLAGQLPAAGTGGKLLLDVAYDPWPSAFAAAWEERGGATVPGLEMLLYQAVEQVRFFTSAVVGGPDGTDLADQAGLINAMCDAVGLPRR